MSWLSERWNKTIQFTVTVRKIILCWHYEWGRVNDKWFVYDISPQEIDPASVNSSTILLLFLNYAVDLDIFEVGENILPRIVTVIMTSKYKRLQENVQTRLNHFSFIGSHHTNRKSNQTSVWGAKRVEMRKTRFLERAERIDK